MRLLSPFPQYEIRFITSPLWQILPRLESLYMDHLMRELLEKSQFTAHLPTLKHHYGLQPRMIEGIRFSSLQILLLFRRKLFLIQNNHPGKRDIRRLNAETSQEIPKVLVETRKNLLDFPIGLRKELLHPVPLEKVGKIFLNAFLILRTYANDPIDTGSLLFRH